MAGMTCTVEEAAKILGVSPWAFYKSIRAGNPPVQIVRVGRRVIVPTANLRKILGLSGEAAP